MNNQFLTPWIQADKWGLKGAVMFSRLQASLFGWVGSVWMEEFIRNVIKIIYKTFPD